jgi:predicted CoA-substrate-specific enzyme activase
MVYYVGVDAGSVSINCMVIDEQEHIVYEAPYIRHFGLVSEEVHRLLSELFSRFDPRSIRSIAFTGMHGQLLSETLSAPYEIETIVQVLGTAHVVPGVRTIIGVGGQDAALFQLGYEGCQWILESFNMNGPCASGTGSFVDQQAERLAQSMYGSDFHMNQEQLQNVLDDFIALGIKSVNPAPVACRCTVFTKSDMIHLQNKGESLANIIAGIHYGNAANYVSTIAANRDLSSPMVFIGGMASNRLQVKAFQHYFPDLQVPPHHTSLGALGVALHAGRQGWVNEVDLSRLITESRHALMEFPRTEPLGLMLTHFDPDNSLPAWDTRRANPVKSYLGVDIGSTTTKYALIDEEGNIIHKCYVPTQGRPIEVTQRLLKALDKEMGKRIQLTAIATTGSGRNVVGDFLSADLIIDEITAHAGGAVEFDPDIDTIFEIGGQDSKYIHIERTHPIDFDMNKVCAAGTGSFLHELANKMKINIVGEFQKIALSARNPVHLAERCTVFMESDLASCAQKGAKREDLIAGLCYAIVYNYLNRVVEKRYIGKRVMFLGGPSLNRGIVAAFEKILGQPLIVPKHREVMGAYGAAIAVRDMFKRQGKLQRNRELGELARMEVKFTEAVCRAEKNCHNECKLKVYKFGERKSIWGGDCGRYEVSSYGDFQLTNLFQERQRLFHQALGQSDATEGQFAGLQKGSKPTVGIPLALHTLDWGIFWTHIFAELGYTPLVSPPTNNQIALSGVECMTSETCFPVKVFHGHVHYLLDKVDYLFLPNVINISTVRPEERGFLCPLVGGSQFMVRAALGIPDDRLIRPNLHLKEGPGYILDPFLRSFPAQLRPTKEILERAIKKAWERQQAFRETLRDRGREFLKQTPPTEPIWIVTGRPYNLYDERLNLQLGRHLAKLGIKALPMDYLDLDSEDLSDFPKMYWGLGARILRAAKRIAVTPNWYGAHLTNFSCGADSFVEHFYRHILKEKPSLILELDEHSAVAGLLTRVEAYRNVVKNLQEKYHSSNGEPELRLEAS